MNPYDIGDVVRISGTFRDFDSVLTDPTDLALEYRKPDGTMASVTWASAAVVRDSLGTFHYNLSVDAAGVWQWRWVATGALQATEQGSFAVRENPVAVAPPQPFGLITVEQAKRHIRLDGHDDDVDVAEKVTEASHIVLNYLKVTDYSIWQDSSGAPIDVPPTIQAATKIVFGNLYTYREGGAESSFRIIEPLGETVKNLLARYRDPAIA